MSLDVYLTTETAEIARVTDIIMIREDGATKEITREEWDSRFPDREPIIAPPMEGSNEVYSANITHNLAKMASEAGVYKCLWRPEEIGITYAKDLIGPLTDGLVRLRASPKHFKQFNPPNGWGSYEGLIRFIEQYRLACRQYSEAKVEVWR